MDQNDPQNVKFDTDTEVSTKSWEAIKYYRETSTPKIIDWAKKYSGGLIKSEKQAEYLLLTFVVIALIISFYLFFGPTLFRKAVPPILPPGTQNPV